MHRPGMSVVLVCVMAGVAAAQAPALDQQVTDQLVARDVVLARRNLGVRVEPGAAPGAEPGAGSWTVALVDLGNGRVAASIQVDAPADPAAALPALTGAAAELAEQVDHRVSELKFQLMSLRFDAASESQSRRSRSPRQWQVFRGQRGEAVEAPEFFEMVGRGDLARSYRRRHLVMSSSYAVAVAGFATAAVLTIENQSPITECHVDQSDEEVCLQRKQKTLAPIIVALAAGVAGIAVGTYLYRHPQPIDEDDARALADAYNQRLRGALRLRAATPPPRRRDVALVPYLDRSDAGLALAGRF